MKFISFVLLLSTCAFAQVDRASLNGTVTDASGSAVGTAKVEISNDTVGFRRATLTVENGSYSVPALPVGKYAIRVEKEGFRPVVFDEVVLTIGQRRTLDVRLEVGAVATAIEVQADATPIEQSSAEIGLQIGEKQIRELPLNGRNWTGLMLLAPGAVNDGAGNQNSIRFFGRARDENNWTFDGMDSSGVKDPRQEGNLRLVIPMDSIAEFRVNSATYNAESGTGAGAQVNLVSKTGTNNYHGSLFWFLRNSALDARRPFDGSTVPPFRLNQFGGSLGGPIVKDKSYFFVNYEGLRQRLSQTNAGGLVPSASFRQRVIVAQPVLKPYMDAYPVGNGGSVNADTDRFLGIFPQVANEDAGMVRFDHRFNEKHSLFTRFNFVKGFLNENRSNLLEPRESKLFPLNGTFQYQSVISSRVVNEVKLGVNRSALDRGVVGLRQEGLEIPGFTTTQASTNEIEKPTAYSVVDNVSYLTGRHTFKFGGEFRRIHLNVGNALNASIRFASRDDVLRNRVDRLSINGPLDTVGVRRNYSIFYAQDEWKIRPDFTVNYGVRYENYSVVSEVAGRGNNRVIDFERCGGFCAPTSEWYFPDNNNFAPRLGLAWSPKMFGRRATVLRAGFGMFYGPGQNDDVTAAIDSIPERFQLTIADQPALSLPIDPFIAQAKSQGLSPRAVQRDRRDQYSSQWNFSIQQELGWSLVGQVGYVGNKGTHLFGRDRQNVLDPVTRRRPYAGFNDVDRKVNYNRSSFHGLQAGLNRSFARGVLVQAQYLYGKVIDDSAGSGDGQEIMIANCRTCDRGPADFDIRHHFTANGVYDLPCLRANRYLGGWSLSGLLTARTGRAVNVTVDRSSANTPNGSTVRQRPDLVPGVPVYLSNPGPNGWLNPAAFRAPANGTWGNLGRNAVRGPRLWQADVALAKRTAITEQLSVEFRAEAFNLFNRAQFGNPQGNSSRSDFGLIRSTANDGATGTGTSRQLQFMLRLAF